MISRFTLNAAGTGGGRGVRAGDPARARRSRSATTTATASRARTRTARTSAAAASASTPTATSTSAPATTSTRSARAATATRRSTSATRSATTRATRPPTRTTCAARSCASTRWRTRRARGVGTTTHPGGQHVRRRARRRRSPRSSRWASATRSRSRPTRAHPGTVVVGEYGPDAGTNSATRGPAGIIEWNRVDQARLLRLAAVRGRQLGRQQLLPLHVPERPVRRALRLLGGGDPERVAEQHRPAEHPRPGRRRRRVAQAHGRPSGAVRDPGPVARRRSRSPARSTATTPSNPSTTKWPAYYDGAWFILDRSQNWWRETRVKDDGSGILRVNGLFGSSQFGSPSHTYPIPVKFGPDGALYMATWGFDCCRAQLPTSQPGRLMRVDFIADEVDTTAPVVDADRDRHPQRRRRLPRPRDARRLTATDSSGVARMEYSTDGGQNWTTLHRAGRLHHARRLHGARTARPTARDAEHLGGRRRSTFSVVSGDALPAGAVGRVQRRAGHEPLELPPLDDAGLRRGGAVRGRRQPRAAARRTTRSTSRARARSGCSAQPLPDGRLHAWSRRSRLRGWTPTSAAGQQPYAQVGLKIFQTNDNWIKVAHTRNADGNPTGSAQTYFEMTYEPNGTRTLGTRMGLARHEPADVVDADRPHRQHDHVRLLAHRSGRRGRELGRAQRLAEHRHGDAGGRRPALHRRLRRQRLDLGPLRLHPDHAGQRRSTARRRRRSHTLAPARRTAPTAGTARVAGHARGAATRASASRASTRTEYRVGGGAFAAYSAPFSVGGDGTHTVEYRSTDKAGNAETAKAVDGQGRRDRAGTTTATPDGHRPGHADADRGGRHVGRGADRVPGQHCRAVQGLRARRGSRPPSGSRTTRRTSRRSRPPARTRSSTARPMPPATSRRPRRSRSRSPRRRARTRSRR